MKRKILRVELCRGCIKEDACFLLKNMSELVSAGIKVDHESLADCKLRVVDDEYEEEEELFCDCDNCPMSDECEDYEPSTDEEVEEDVDDERAYREKLHEDLSDARKTIDMMAKLSKIIGKNIVGEVMTSTLCSVIEVASRRNDRIRKITIDKDTVKSVALTDDKRVRVKGNSVSIHYKGMIVPVVAGNTEPGIPEFDVVPM